MNALYIVLGVVALFIIIIIARNIKIVPQAHAYVIERLGAYSQTWGTGLHLKVPFIDRISKRVSLKEQVVDFPPQPVITRDNVTMQIDTVVYFEITDPKLRHHPAQHHRRSGARLHPDLPRHHQRQDPHHPR